MLLKSAVNAIYWLKEEKKKIASYIFKSMINSPIIISYLLNVKTLDSERNMLTKCTLKLNISTFKEKNLYVSINDCRSFFTSYVLI